MSVRKSVRAAFAAVVAVFGMAMGALADDAPDFFVDYILSSATNQYIDTGLVNSGNYKAELTFQFDSITKKTSIAGCSQRKFQYVNGDGYFGIYYSNSAKLLNTPDKVTAVTGVKYRMVSELAAGTQDASVIDVASGETLTSYTASISTYTDKTAPFYLLNYYNESTGGAFTKVSTVRLYGCKLWRKLKTEGDYTPVRDFRPAVKDGRSGLWDDVEKKMYYAPSGVNFAIGMNTCSTWTGGGTTAKWSETANWDVAPSTNVVAKLVFKPGENTLMTENDIPGLSICNLAVIGTNGTFNLSGQKLTFYPFGGNAVSAVHSNLTLNISNAMDFKTDGSFQSRGDATFDGDLTFADGIEFGFDSTWSTAGESAYVNTFNGAFFGPQAKIALTQGQNASRAHVFKFNKPVNVKEFVFGRTYLNNYIYFNASGNTIGKMNLTGHTAYFRAENPLTSGTVVNWFNCDGYVRTGKLSLSKDGNNTVELDRIMGESSYSGSGKVPMAIGQTMQAETTSKNTTLHLRGTADATCYGYFAKGISLVWDPTGDYTQEFRDRIHQMNGTITVKGGTFKSGGTNEFPNVSKVIICDGAKFVAESTMPFTSGNVNLEIQGSGKLVLPTGSACSFKSVTVDDIPVAGTNYVGVGYGGEGKVVAAWLEGNAVITAPQINATFWMTATDGDWGTAANWSDGVPSVDKMGYVAAKGGDYTVTVKESDAAAGTLAIVNNGTGKATVKLEGTVAWPNANCTIMQGGQLEIPEGATLNCNDSSAKFTVDKGEFLVSGGTATFSGAETNNFTGTFTVSGDETHTGRVSVTAGTFCYEPKQASTYRMKVQEFGRLDVSGTGRLATFANTTDDGAVIADGGDITFSGEGIMSTGVPRVSCAEFGTGRTVFSDSSVLHVDAGKSDSKIAIRPSAAGETAYVEFRDQARLEYGSSGAVDGFNVGDMANATGILVFASSVCHLNGGYASYRVNIGTTSYACGILRVEAGYLLAGGPRGVEVAGSPKGKYGSVQVNNHGELHVSGGCCCLRGRSGDSEEAYMSGLVIGDASNINSTKDVPSKYYDETRLAEGLLTLSGEGIITNLYGITVIGGGRGTGLFRQTGGTYEQCSTAVKSPFVVGNAGGFGTYLLSGGEANLNGDMFIGGTFTNHIGSGVYMAAWGYPVDCHTATGIVEVTGGKLAVAKDLNLGFDGRGVLAINGKGGEVTVGGDLVLSNTVVSADASTSSALKFTLDEDGVQPIKVTGNFVNTYGTVIEVDVTKFAGTNGKCKLITFDAFDGAEPEVRFIGPNAESMVSVRSEHALRVGLPRGFSIFVQ